MYGRHGSFRQSPIPQHRLGRFKTGATPLVQLTPVSAIGNTEDTADKRFPVGPAAADSGPVIGLTGVLVYEETFMAYNGLDPILTRPNDIDKAPAFTQAQVVHGTEVKLLVQNIAASTFDGQRTYPGRNVFLPSDIAGLTIGDMVTPGAGDDTNGYWKKTTTAANAWGHVVEFDLDYSIVVFQLSF